MNRRGSKPMAEPYWALAAGCVPDALPWEIPRIAHEAGFETCGMWVDPATTWDGGALERTRTALTETGIKLIDVEALWLGDGDRATDAQKPILDAGLRLGARNVLVVSRHDDYAASLSQFRELCEWVGDGIRINLEFGEFTPIKSLSAAQAFIAAVDHSAAGILIDLMHLNRADDALPSLDSELFSYVQACDFLRSSAAMTGADYVEAAVDGRCPLGEGEARRGDLEAVCRSELDVSLEIRSKALRDAFPNPVERAKQIRQRCQRSAFQ